MILRWSLLVGWLFLAASVRAVPTNRYVSLAGGNVSPYDSWAKAGTSLKTVVDYANTFNEGDTVWVSNGVYTLTATINLLDTRVKSFNTNVAATRVNGNGAYRCWTMNHTNAWLEGFVISNGYVTSDGGAGIWLVKGGTVTNCKISGCYAFGTYTSAGGVRMNTGLVANCSIVSNWSFSEGGGVYVVSTPSAIRNCTVSHNTSGRGGGIAGASAAAGSLVDNCVVAFNLATNPALNYGAGGIYGGMTVTNCRIYGNTTAAIGGGASGGMILRNCAISNNTAAIYGGGIGSWYKTGPIINCLVANNTASNLGGGMFFSMNSTVVSNCIIIGNTAGEGGGACLYYPYEAGARFDVYNCLFADNVATNSGGGVMANFVATRNPMILQNCTVVSNRALGASGVGGMWVRNASAMATFVNVIAYFNAGAGASNWQANSATICFSNSCTAPTGGVAFVGSANIDLDPRFVSPVSGNYHLQKGSPCINTGLAQDWMINTLDLDGRPRIRELQVDMGAYEYFPMGGVVMFR